MLRALFFVVVAAAPAGAQTLTLSANSTVGCRPVTATITLPTAATADTTFALSSSNAAVTVPASATVPSGASTTSFEVATVAVAADASATIAATSSSETLTRTLQVRPLTVSALAMAPNRIGPNGSSTGTVTLTCAAGPGDVVVNLSSNNTLVTVPASVTLPAGVQSATFIAQAGTPTAETAVSIRATAPGGQRATTLTVKVPTVSSVLFSPATPVGGSPTTGTITLDFPAGAGGQVVSLASNNTTVASPDVASVTVAEGATSATFGVTTTSVINDVVVTFSATTNGVTKTKTMTVRKNRIENYNISSPSLTVCRAVTAEVKLFAAAGPGGVTLNVVNGRTDLATTSVTQLLIPEGERRATFTINAVGRVNATTTADIAVTFPRSASDIQTETAHLDVIRVSRVACP